MTNCLVIGGAGYIGSHLIHKLLDNNDECFIVDNLSTGKKERVPSTVKFSEFDAKDTYLLTQFIAENSITRIFHMAAKRNARESMIDSFEYWNENVGITLSLINSVQKTDVEAIIFSSSCSVYGDAGLVSSDSSFNPHSVYGNTKLTCEKILKSTSKQFGFKLGILRYFNVIGSCKKFNIVDEAIGAIVPTFTDNIFSSAPINIFGKNFDTNDGTAVRDYIDVRDVVTAHLFVADELEKIDYFEALVSTGNPRSVLDVAKQIMNEVGTRYEINFLDRKEGDPGSVWATKDPRLEKLGWTAQYSFEESIASHVHGRRINIGKKLEKGR
jgi:UDP-glucose 4-epimerase